MPTRTKFDVAGKNALITGAGQGIGLALARILRSAGAHVCLVDVNEAALNHAVRELGAGATGYTADVRNRKQMAQVVAKASADHEGLDVVVANAGVTPPPATIRTMDLKAYDRVIGINQVGVLNTVHPALEQIIGHRGHVVVVSSCAAFSPGIGGVAYMSSKAAAEQIGRALNLELAPHGASAGVAYFGFVDTPLAQATLDEDAIGRQLDKLLGWPLNHRITAEAAAASIAAGIARRAPRTIAPARWLPYELFRGVINVGLDRVLAHDRRVHQMLHELEAQGSA